MRKLFYLGIEKINARYSLQLESWNTTVFKRHGIDHEVIYGEDLTGDQIVTGSVLDCHGRSYYSLTQMANLVKTMKEGKITNDDVIFFEDATTMGIESLPYIFDQIPKQYKPKVYTRFLANTPDPDDFLARNGSFKWARPFEEMIDNFVDGIIVANEEFVSHLRISGFKSDIFVTGLPFGADEVRSRVENIKPIDKRKKRVCFAARWDDEKNPAFYMNLAKEYFKIDPAVEFAVCCGHPELKSNNENNIKQALELENSNLANFKIYKNLKKNEYYALLADSCILFNCALQDWFSNTISEMGALGGIALYPAYRSFPETLANNSKFMYAPWCTDHAIEQMKKMFNNLTDYDMTPLVNYADGAIDRTLDIFEGKANHLKRNTLDYRKYVTIPKYTWNISK